MCGVYRAKIIDISPESLVIEATGNEAKIESLLEVLKPYGITETVRTGIVAMARGTGAAEKIVPSRTSRVAADAAENLGNYSV